MIQNVKKWIILLIRIVNSHLSKLQQKTKLLATSLKFRLSIESQRFSSKILQRNLLEYSKESLNNSLPSQNTVENTIKRQLSSENTNLNICETPLKKQKVADFSFAVPLSSRKETIWIDPAKSPMEKELTQLVYYFTLFTDCFRIKKISYKFNNIY